MLYTMTRDYWTIVADGIHDSHIGFPEAMVGASTFAARLLMVHLRRPFGSCASDQRPLSLATTTIRFWTSIIE